MSSEKFETLEEDLQAVCDFLAVKIEDQLPQSAGEESKKLTNEVTQGLDEAKSLLQQMDAEVAAAPMPYRSDMAAKSRKYSEEVGRLSIRFRKHLSDYGLQRSARQALLGQPSQASAVDARQLALQGTAVLDRTSQSLFRTHQVAAETEAIGNEIIDELGVQRESLLRTKQRLDDTDVELGTSRKILKAMYRKVIANKIILVCIILFELGILGIVCYWKFRK